MKKIILIIVFIILLPIILFIENIIEQNNNETFLDNLSVLQNSKYDIEFEVKYFDKKQTIKREFVFSGKDFLESLNKLIINKLDLTSDGLGAKAGFYDDNLNILILENRKKIYSFQLYKNHEDIIYFRAYNYTSKENFRSIIDDSKYEIIDLFKQLTGENI